MRWRNSTITDPKAYVIIMVMITQYLAPTRSSMPIAIIVAVFTVNNLAAIALWTFIGDKLAQAFRKKRAT
jgi:threonine/homoserine/homoserine lactone efflux protein